LGDADDAAMRRHMKHGVGFKAGAERLGDETAMTMLVVVISQSVVPVFVAVALLTSPIDALYIGPAVGVYALLLLCNVRDYRRVRRADWLAFDPNFVFFETCLGSIAAGFLILCVGTDAPLYRQLLLIVMLTAAAVGDRAFVWGTWVFGVAVLVVVTWVGGTRGVEYAQVIVLDATAWAAVVAAFDMVVRRDRAVVGAKTALGVLAAQAGQAQSLEDGIIAAAPAIAAALDVDRATVLVRPRSGDALRELITWPSAWPAGTVDATRGGLASVAEDALEGAAPTGGFVRRDGLAAIATQAADVDLVLVVPSQTTHRVVLDERATKVVAGLLGTMADHVTHISGLLDRAATDELTGVANRRSLLERLPASFGRATRDGAPLCLVMIDLDRFKSFNDSFGHLAGDRILLLFAAMLCERVRAQDLVARYGGEEFCIVLEKADLTGARTVIEGIAERPVSDGEGRTVTFSAGIAQWDGHEDSESLIRRADEALYRAKELGRNRTEVALHET
jgi:diguanylate cyclase (GGDEF)-like protein